MFRTVKAVIFDLDGTLIDSLPDLTSAVNWLMGQHGRDFLSAADVAAMVGDGAMSLVQRAFAARGGFPDQAPAIILRQFMDHYEAHSAVLTTAYDGVAEALQAFQAAGLKLGICTNKPTAATHAILQHLGLDAYFQCVAGSDDVPAIKPDPGHLLHVLQHLEILPENAIMIGDSHNDILTAKAAKVRSIAVSFGYAHGPVEQLGADRIVSSYRDLSDLLLPK